MKYERLRDKMHKDRQTFIDQDGEYWAVGNMDNFTGAVKGIAINKLAELEDKIEQGTLVDTEAYFIVEENQWAGKNRFLVCQNAIRLAVCDFCESREEAEKRLKEYKNEEV